MIHKCAESRENEESRENVFFGPTAAGVTAPVKRPAGCVHCGHLGILTPAPLQRGGRVEGAAGALGAVEEEEEEKKTYSKHKALRAAITRAMAV